MGYRDALPRSLLDGMAERVCEALEISSLRHRSAMLELCRRERIPAGAVAAPCRQIEANWQACEDAGLVSGSRQNWRWRVPQLGIAPHNLSPEVGLERAIVEACERQRRPDWANQVPVASGIAGPSRERRRAIDLVQQVLAGHFRFVELKIASDTPLYAAIEIIAYACLWLLSRQRGGQGTLLAAQTVEALVLAPHEYYRGVALGPLEAQLHAELAELGAAHGVSLGFGFRGFEAALATPPYADERLMRLLDAVG